MTTIIYGVFDEHGRPLGFYPTDVYPPTEDGKVNSAIPAGAVVVSHNDWQTLLANQPRAVYVAGKVQIRSEPTPSALA
jgi:hypothetical protein